MEKNSINFSKLIRKRTLEMVHRANASHIGSCLSIADIVAVLYSDVMNFEASNPSWVMRDRFILSKGHAAAILYAALAEIGFFNSKLLDTYGENGSLLMTHINHKIPGVEFSTGSLGHGLPFAVGKALSAKRLKKDWRTFTLLSDGEMDEGSNWEALMFAAHHKLDNLIAIIDYNKLQSLDTVQNTLSLEPLALKLTSFGLNVVEIDGHNHQDLFNALNQTPGVNIKPTAILAHTIKGKGVSFMENKVEWHYKSPNDTQLAQAFKELGT